MSKATASTTGGIAVIDTLIGFRRPDGDEHPAAYLYKDIPDGVTGDHDLVADTLAEMDAHGVAVGLVSLSHPVAGAAARARPDRFVLASDTDPHDVVGTVRRIREEHEEHGTRAVQMVPLLAQVPVDDARWHPIYTVCAELGLPVFCTAGVPGPRMPMAPQHVERFDRVCYDFPDLTIVLRHGAEPWEELAVKLMLKWPGLHWSSSAFAPKHYPRAIIDYANTRGADKVLYGGYFPYALTLDRIFTELEEVPFRDEVWPKFLRLNAARILRLDP